MTISNALLRAKSIGVRNFRDGASRFIRRHEFLIITERGAPASVLLPYNDVLEIVDILEELEDRKTVKAIAEGRRAIRKGAKGIPVSKALKRN
jgi:PHD/YefM family antitoxin component YafN of YafNO toxin-antitoxin module